MKRDQEYRLRAFLRDEHGRGVSREDAVKALHQQFGERSARARLAGKWYDDAAAGKEIVESGQLTASSLAANDACVPFTVRNELTVPRCTLSRFKGDSPARAIFADVNDIGNVVDDRYLVFCAYVRQLPVLTVLDLYTGKHK